MNLNDCDHAQRCLKVLMQHLEELRPILSTDPLNGEGVNSARELVRTFVLAETSSEPFSTIFDVTGGRKDGILEIGDDRALELPTWRIYWPGAMSFWLTDQEQLLMSKVLHLLVALAQNSSPSRQRRDYAEQLRDRASDFVEMRGGEPWERTAPCRGVTLMDAAAILTDGNRDAARMAVKGWHNSTNPKLPSPVGTLATDSRKNIYDREELTQFIRLVEGSNWGKEQDDHLATKDVQGKPLKPRIRKNRLQSSEKSTRTKSARTQKAS